MTPTVSNKSHSDKLGVWEHICTWITNFLLGDVDPPWFQLFQTSS